MTNIPSQINSINPLSVCVIIAAYNSESTISRAIKSALSEPEVTGVVVIDDYSQDNTISQAKAADDGSGRLKVLKQSINYGPSAARNRALRESTSAWISILDADDFFLPGRIKNLLNYTNIADLIADDMWQVSENDINGPRKSLMGEGFVNLQIISFNEFVLSNVTRAGRQRRELGFIKPLIRREYLTQYKIHYQEHMRLGEDFELYARMLALGAKLLLVPRQGYVSVVRENSLSSRHSETDLLHLRNSINTLKKDLKLSPSNIKALNKVYLSIDCRLQWRLLIQAVKNKNTSVAIRTFRNPCPVQFYLIKQLSKQFFIRTLKQVRGK